VTLQISGTTGCLALQTLVVTTHLVGVKDEAGNIGVGVETAIYTKQ
jgi:RIO-like serine/threonine protein kinase